MALIEQVFSLIFGGGRNAVVETAQVFRENAEAGAARDTETRHQTLAQFASEFGLAQRSGFDRVMDGVNRIPRPALALGTLGLFITAMIDPVWFSARMQGLSLVPQPLWWLLGVIVSFYFGARHQMKSQEFQRDLAATLARTPQVLENLNAMRVPQADTPGVADPGTDARLAQKGSDPDENPALDVWRRRRHG